MTEAANCIRMAVAIETAHTFSIEQLHSKLCQKHCDGVNCGNLAPYIDVFCLNRRCLSIAKGCRIPCGPFHPTAVIRTGCKPDLGLLPTARFKAIPGRYGCENWDAKEPSHYFYNFDDMKSAFLCDETEQEFTDYEQMTAEYNWIWRLCSVAAPWLSKVGMTTETGVFCEICGVFDPDNMDYDPGPRKLSREPWSIRQAKEEHGSPSHWTYYYKPDPMWLKFMTVSELKKHMAKKHGDDHEKEA